MRQDAPDRPEAVTCCVLFHRPPQQGGGRAAVLPLGAPGAGGGVSAHEAIRPQPVVEGLRQGGHGGGVRGGSRMLLSKCSESGMRRRLRLQRIATANRWKTRRPSHRTWDATRRRHSAGTAGAAESPGFLPTPRDRNQRRWVSGGTPAVRPKCRCGGPYAGLSGDLLHTQLRGLRKTPRRTRPAKRNHCSGNACLTHVTGDEGKRRSPVCLRHQPHPSGVRLMSQACQPRCRKTVALNG
jgi:hypothetical protein